MRSVAFLFGSLALGLTACAPEREDKDSAPGSLPGYELASAKVAKPAAQPSIIDLSVAQLAAMQSAGEVRLIDVRRNDEVIEGMIPGAEHIAMDGFDPAKVTAGDDRPIVIYCRSGRRSQIVAEQLAAHTGKPAVHLEGGILAWAEAGKALHHPD